MFYICYKPTNKWYHFEVAEFDSEAEVIKFIEDKHIPQTRLAGVFKGERLNPLIGEKRVTKKMITGFGKFEEVEDEA